MFVCLGPDSAQPKSCGQTEHPGRLLAYARLLSGAQTRTQPMREHQSRDGRPRPKMVRRARPCHITRNERWSTQAIHAHRVPPGSRSPLRQSGFPHCFHHLSPRLTCEAGAQAFSLKKRLPHRERPDARRAHQGSIPAGRPPTSRMNPTNTAAAWRTQTPPQDSAVQGCRLPSLEP